MQFKVIRIESVQRRFRFDCGSRSGLEESSASQAFLPKLGSADRLSRQAGRDDGSNRRLRLEVVTQSEKSLLRYLFSANSHLQVNRFPMLLEVFPISSLIMSL